MFIMDRGDMLIGGVALRMIERSNALQISREITMILKTVGFAALTTTLRIPVM